MIKKLFATVIAISMLSCGRNSENYYGGSPVNGDSRYSDDAGSLKFDRVSYQSKYVTERKLIKHGNLNFEVSDINSTKKMVTDKATEFGAYIAEESRDSNNRTYRQLIRVPYQHLDEFMSFIEGIAKTVDSESVNIEDVTEEYIDAEIRVKTKKELESRYRELLKQAKAVKDILEIETQLGNVRTDIETMEGKLKYLNNQVAFSTLVLKYYETVSANNGFGHRLSRTFGNGWDTFLDFLIGVFETWPFLLIGSSLIWLFIRWRRKRKLPIIQS
jgi:hypothetical protein